MFGNRLFRGLFRFSDPENKPVDPDLKSLQQVGCVVSDARRCVQCGVCSYNCPIGIPVRDYARQGLAVQNSECITCGQCIQVCPRGTLRWQTKAHQLIDNPVFDRQERGS